jgi:serine protease Do
MLSAASILPLNGASAAVTGPPSGGGDVRQVQIDGTASALQLGNAFAAVANAVQPAVVFIRVESVTTGLRTPSDMPLSLRGAFAGAFPRVTTTSGTGFIILPNGYIVTNQHVIDGARRVFVRLFDGREYEAEIVGEDVLSDIAVIRIDETDLRTAFLGDSDQIRVGEWVLAIGNPMGNTLMFSVTAGIVSATDRSMIMPNSRGSVQEYIQTDAVANGGNSGGPLVDLYGQIIGMNSAIASRSGYYQGYTLAIPANLILPVVSQLMKQGRVTRGVLGAATSRATVEDAVAVGLDTICGVVVQDVGDSDSPARRSGLRPGDVIVEVDGYRVMSAAQLERSVWFKAPGDSVVLLVHRATGVVEDLTVYLGAEEMVDQTASGRAENGQRDLELPCADHPLGICLVAFDRARGLPAGIAQEVIGPVVTGVYPVGPSYGKIFADYDIITHVNNVRVRSEKDVEDALHESVQGDIVSVQTYRFHADETGFARIRIR